VYDLRCVYYYYMIYYGRITKILRRRLVFHEQKKKNTDDYRCYNYYCLSFDFIERRQYTQAHGK